MTVTNKINLQCRNCHLILSRQYHFILPPQSYILHLIQQHNGLRTYVILGKFTGQFTIFSRKIFTASVDCESGANFNLWHLITEESILFDCIGSTSLPLGASNYFNSNTNFNLLFMQHDSYTEKNIL